MLKWIDQIPLHMIVMVSLTLGLAPFVPEPHIVEKLRMLASGTLSKPIDILDLLMHGTPWLLLVLRLARLGLGSKSN